MPRPRKSESEKKNPAAPTAPDAAAPESEEQEVRKNRAKGAGSLFKRGKFWSVRWMVNGRVYVRSTKEGNRKKAEKVAESILAPFQTRKEEEILQTLAARVEGLKRETNILPLDKAWDKFDASLARKTVSPLVNRIYHSRFRAFVAWMKENRPEVSEMRAVTDADAEAFMRAVRAKKSPKTFNDYRAVLSQMWRILADDARLDSNPWQKIQPLERETHVRRELSVDELAAVVERTEGEMRVLFALGIYTGLRLGDCLALDWEVVDFVRGFIQWTPSKTKKHGTIVRIPLFPALARILEETPKARRHGVILPGLAADYERCNPQFCRKVKALFEESGIATQSDTGRVNPKTKTKRKAVDVGFHSFRHTFVSLCANAGVPLAVVQAIVGHTNAAMTSHYFHVSDDALKSAVAALPDVMNPAAALPAPAAALPAPVSAPSFDAERFKAELEALTPAQLDEAARILAAVRAAV